MFTYDGKSKEFFLKGDIDSVNKIVKQFGEIGKDIEIISDESEESNENEFDEWIANIDESEHVICPHSIFNHHGTRTVIGKVLRKVYGEDIIDKPIPNLKYYWDVVKKWYNHKIPLNKGDEYVYTLKPVYTYFTPRGKSKNGEEIKPVIYQAKEHVSGKLYFLPDDCENPKECSIDDLIRVDEDKTNLVLQETRYGDKLFAKIKYEESYFIEDKTKIFPYELADECVKTYWENGKLNNEYKVTTYIA